MNRVVAVVLGVQLLIQLLWGLILWAALYAVGSPLGLMRCTVVGAGRRFST